MHQNPSVKSEIEIEFSSVENNALTKSSFEAIYPPTEKIPAIVVESFPELGKFAAVRFLEWVQQNPGGVISLPTGKTPEFFIKWVKHFIRGWDKPGIQKELEEAGIDPDVKPDMKSLYFVQIDEFYPMDSAQANSFYYYVNKYYINEFALDPKKAMLVDASKIGLRENEKLSDIWPEGNVDLTLRYRHPKDPFEYRQKQVLDSVDQWCMEYEEKIRRLGGIGFFLGGIGPDGHIGFNISGSDHNSTTRLCPINYETQAAASVDLGGIEIARKSLVITIGLRTITRNKNCTAIIIAAGAAKASVVANAIQSETDINVPATVLHKLPNARFYLTKGSAKNLADRQLDLLNKNETITDADTEKILIDLSASRTKKLTELSKADSKNDRFATILL